MDGWLTESRSSALVYGRTDWTGAVLLEVCGTVNQSEIDGEAVAGL